MSPRTQDALGRKAGRFDPSEPLHMTTRHAAKKGRPNGTPSINGSVEDHGSRRGSVDGMRPATAHSSGSPSSLKDRRVSGESAKSSFDTNSFNPQKSVGKKSFKDPTETLRTPQQIESNVTQSPSRKRKRAFTPPAGTYGSSTIVRSVALSQAAEVDPKTSDDAMESVREDGSSDGASASSSSGHDVEGYPAATQSTEITPAATPMGSEPVSPVSEDTNQTPRNAAKNVDIVMKEAENPAEEDELDEADDDDMPKAVEDVDDMADGDDDEDQVTTGPRRRNTARRRADHHEIEIEAAMRRQAQLKSAYRSIARALKPLLAEIACKTVEDLESNPRLHHEVAEFEGSEDHEGIRQLLGDALERRKQQLNAQLRLNREQLTLRLLAEKTVCRASHAHGIDNMRQKRLDEAEYEMLKLGRSLQLEMSRGQEVTDDEDGDVLPRPKYSDYRFTRGGPLDPRHESRSRVALDTERAIADMQQRFEMHQMLEDAKQQDDLEESQSFTVMDATVREAANAKREGVLNTNILADAAAEVDRRANVPVIPNEQAFGLQLLGDLASRPSVRASVQPAVAPRRLGHPFTPANEQSQMLPPNSLTGLSFHGMPRNAPTQMSPGTAQFIERSMPYSPRRRLGEETQPERPSWEPSLMSPSSRSDNRLSTFPALASLLQSPSLNPPGIGKSASRHHSRQTSFSSQPEGHSAQDTMILRPSVPREDMSGFLSDLDRSEPSRPGAQVREDAIRDRYNRPLRSEIVGPPESSSERAIHAFSKGGPLSIERLAPEPEGPMGEDGRLEAASHTPDATETEPIETTEAREDDPDSEAEGIMGFDEDLQPDSPSIRLKSARQGSPSEQPSSEGAVDLRKKENEAEHSLPARALSEEEQTRKTHSRASSPGHSTTTDVSGSQDGDRGQRRSSKDASTPHGKTSKADRKGLSRKAHKESRRLHDKKIANALKRGTEGGSQMFRFRLSTMESKRNPHPPHIFTDGGVPQTAVQGAEIPYAPLPGYMQQPPPPPPPPPGFAPPYGPHPMYPYLPEFYYHHTSLPGTLPHALAPWPLPYYVPSYSHPRGPPPPQGPGPENWSTAPPPHPGAPQNSMPSPAPQFQSQFGGPTIAPATSDARYPFGSGPPGGNHPPAFAQQQRNSEGGGSRRRTQSDAPRQTKFHHYAGPRK